MKEALLYRQLKNNQVQCQVCSHYCLIKDSSKGKCGVRENKNGILYSLTYAKPCAIHIDPIEKKPLYHFLPNTKTLSIATLGCNFSCLFCQNWQISQAPKIGKPPHQTKLWCGGKGLGFTDLANADFSEAAPEKVVETALQNNLPSISYTYTEPTVFLEYALDIMKLAKEKGLKNIWVSNGFFSKETFEVISPFLDATNIDLKSFTDDFYQKICGARLQPVLDNLKRLKQAGIWLEITTLIIPTLNNKEEIFRGIADFIKKELGAQTPWHISRFSPEISWKLRHLPQTPLPILKKAQEIGKKAGLKNIHLGNVWL